jgi:hypothetical protein
MMINTDKLDGIKASAGDQNSQGKNEKMIHGLVPEFVQRKLRGECYKLMKTG